MYVVAYCVYERYYPPAQGNSAKRAQRQCAPHAQTQRVGLGSQLRAAHISLRKAPRAANMAAATGAASASDGLWKPNQSTPTKATWYFIDANRAYAGGVFAGSGGQRRSR